MSPEQDDHDELTGALDRRAFDERVEQAIETAVPFTVCLLDLDRFKVINDSHGHDAGKVVLQEVATRLQEALWTDDAVGRFGGDEFIVLLAGGDEERALRAADKMRRVVSQPMAFGGTTITPDISVGMALYPDHGTGVENLVQHAHQELEKVKREKRDSD